MFGKFKHFTFIYHEADSGFGFTFYFKLLYYIINHLTINNQIKNYMHFIRVYAIVRLEKLPHVF